MNTAKLFENMSIEELKNIEEEVRKGKIKQLIENKSKQSESKTCAVCGEVFAKNQGFVLEFGSPEFRRRAHFCAVDCMEYFVNNLKKSSFEFQKN